MDCDDFSQIKIKYFHLLYNIASGSDIMPYIKIDKPLVIYRFWYHSEMMLITMSRTFGKMLTFSHQKHDYKIILMIYDEKNQTSCSCIFESIKLYFLCFSH